MELLSTQQAAERLGIDPSGVRKLILNGRLPSNKLGRDHLINESDLALVADRKPGRPPKPKDETGAAEVVTATAKGSVPATAPAKAMRQSKATRQSKAKATKKARTKGK